MTKRERGPGGLAVWFVAAVLAVSSGCVLSGSEFRAIAGPAVENGVTQIVNGLLDGLFAVIAPETGGAANN